MADCWGRVLAVVLAALYGVAGASAQTAPDPAAAERSAETELAKKVQNPVGNLYSIPFQGNFNIGYGPHKGTQEQLNFQPVIPIQLNSDWNVITRTIVPFQWQPSLQPDNTVPFGTTPASFSAFLSPGQPVNGTVWGAGPIVQFPTASDGTLGSRIWGAGPAAVLVHSQGPWVFGGLANNVWSFGGTTGKNGTRFNNFLFQPFANYNFDGGWYVNTVPIFTANWMAAGNNAWTVPVGLGGGRVMKLGGSLPVNFALGAYWNAVTPKNGPRWQIRPAVVLIF